MAMCVDLMEEAFEQVKNDSEKFFDEDFMMVIFEPILADVKPFRSHTKMMFEERLSHVRGSRDVEDKVLPYDLLRAELFYPTRVDVRQGHDPACRLAEVAASRFIVEFRDERRVTSDYLSSVGGLRSMDKISEIDCRAQMHRDASNSISESLHSCLSYGLKTCGTTRLDSMAALGQTCSNNDFGRAAMAKVAGKTASKN